MLGRRDSVSPVQKQRVQMRREGVKEKALFEKE